MLAVLKLHASETSKNSEAAKKSGLRMIFSFYVCILVSTVLKLLPPVVNFSPSPATDRRDAADFLLLLRR